MKLTRTPPLDRLYRLLVEQVADYAIFALDPDGRVLTWNPGAERFKGYSADEIIGRNFSVFYTPEDQAAGVPERLLDEAARTGHAETQGWRVRKDGTRFWAQVTIAAIRDDDGTLTAFAKITRDLTAQRALDERARQLAAEQAAHAATQAKNRELEHLNATLQDQAIELESQTEEAQTLTEELQQSTEELERALSDATRARDAATQAETFSRAILESIADPFVVFDADWRYRFVNSAARQLIESRDAHTAGTPDSPLWERFPSTQGSVFQQCLLDAAAKRVPAHFEAYVPRNAAWYAVEAYPMPGGGMAVQWRDVTEVKRAGEANRYLVRASEILGSSLEYERTLNELAQLVVPELADWCAVDIADEAGCLHQLAVAHVDPAKTKWGRELNRRYPPQPDSPSYNVLRTGKPELYSEITDEMLKAGAIDDEHLAISRALGMRSALVVPLTARGQPLGVLTLVSSESDRRYTDADVVLATELAHRAAIAVENARLHGQALAARDEAQIANRAKMDFLATMSHELRTPLNAIAGYTDLLRLGVKGPLTPEQTQYVDRIERSGRYLLSLVQDVLSFAKLESGHVEVKISPVPIQPLLDELEQLMMPQAQAAKLTLRCTKCDRNVAALGDTERVRQILVNLLTNAVKFTPAGGAVSVGCEANEGSVRVIVSDTGRGIPPDKLEEVFAPFVQLQRDTAGSQAGTGLGLSISRDLARAMRGELLVESTVGEGTTFTLVLPRA